jgi:hypothetical protein
MLFMVVERFAPGRAAEVYAVVRARGRMLPEGLTVVDSWVSANIEVCYQVMACADPLLLQEWVARWGEWGNLVRFEIVPVAPSKETAAAMARMATEANPDRGSGARHDAAPVDGTSRLPTVPARREPGRAGPGSCRGRGGSFGRIRRVGRAGGGREPARPPSGGMSNGRQGRESGGHRCVS